MGERPRTWQQAERRALVADLVRTQGTLQARSEQLQAIFASRWYRLARFSWRLRKGSIFRKAAPPKMAGEESFVRPLNGDTVAAEEPELRLVPSPNNGIAVDLERQRWLGGARMPGLEELRVAAILDEPLETCLTPECDLDTDFGTGDWRERLQAHPPHLLLVESAQAGNGGGWLNAVAPHPGSPQAGLPALRELVAACRERGIPSVFWNTRDPLDFDGFAEAASLFDHVFTVDADRIPAYRQLPGIAAGTVGVLPLAAQPRLHNPIAAGEMRQEVAFAGAYDHDWPGERRRELEDLLDAALPFGLVVYDARAGTGVETQGFPARFHPHVEGSISYGETIDAYKRHPVFLSASPATASPTALSPQVFELLACGATVLSTPSAGIEEILGELVPVAGSREEATEQLGRLLEDDALRRSLAARGRRHVLAAHTYRDRLAELVSSVGFDVPAGTGEETAVLLAVGEAEEPGEAIESLLGQSLAPSEVLFGLTGDAAERDLDRLAKRFPATRLRSIPQDRASSRSNRLRELARLAAAPWVAPMAPTLRYGPHHLRDLVACTRFADAQVIGFGAVGGEPHRYADAVPPHTALAARGLVAARGWPLDESAMRGWFEQGIRIYAGDRGATGGE